MANISILTGPKAAPRIVEGLPFLPGLYIHRTYGSQEEDDYTITHMASGLAVLLSVLESEIEPIRMVFGRMTWDKPAEVIFRDGRYFKLLEEVLSIMKKTKSQLQEERIAADLDGKRQPASGSRWGYKRDVITPELLVEAKTTGKARASVRFDDLEFLTKQAYTQGLIPAYIVDIQSEESFVVVPENDLDPAHLQGLEMLNLGVSKKSFSVTAAHARALTSKTFYSVPRDEDRYLVLNYRTFLNFIKSGL